MRALLIFAWAAEGQRSRADDAQFLIQASFGPTRAALDDLATYASYDDWIAAQVALDASSHRVFIRQRLSPVPSKLMPLLNPVKSGELHDPCKVAGLQIRGSKF